ncbi:MAG: hypothetical protein KGL53_01625, partial [Elusimicrobia bacterium]|nr:hypothetical protein [Elusimicrobiota bacterium]
AAPGTVRRYGLAASFRDVLGAPEPVRRALALYPAFDCWLWSAGPCVSGERPAAEAETLLSYFQSFAAACAALSGTRRTLRVRLTPEARFHATGTDEAFELPRAAAGQDAVCEAAGGRLSLRWGKVPGRRVRLAALAEGMWVEPRDPLVLQPVVMHGLARFSAAAERRFTSVLRGAMDRIRAVDAPLHEEMRAFLRVIVPLDNPKSYGSVSSSYRNLRGALCLSHSDDSLLQEETLIHEFCHQKVNLLLAADPLLEPGQGAQVVYSPLRPDARRLAGLLLGAHAFINVDRYLLRVLRRERFPRKVADSVRTNVARRLCHVDDMLRTVSMYARLTPAGADFLTSMWRAHGLTLHDALDIPEALMEAGRKRWREHRLEKALGETGFYRAAAEG